MRHIGYMLGYVSIPYTRLIFKSYFSIRIVGLAYSLIKRWLDKVAPSASIGYICLICPVNYLFRPIEIWIAQN